MVDENGLWKDHTKMTKKKPKILVYHIVLNHSLIKIS